MAMAAAAVDVPLFDFQPLRADIRATERARRKKATARAARHANDARQGWIADAGRRLLTFAVFAHAGGVSFLIEDARAWAEAQGFPPPPDKRAWGAVPAPLVAAGLLEAAGYGKASDGSPKTIWRLTAAGIKAAQRPDGARE